MNEPFTCADLDEVAEELALGSLSGVERGGAIAHVGSCARCRGIVQGLAHAAEAMLLLAPEEEPPPGFEARVAAAAAGSDAAASAEGRRPSLSRAGSARRRPGARGRARRVAVVAASIAAAVGVGVLGGQAISPSGGPSGIRSALAVAEGGTSTCRAVLVAGQPAQLMVTIDEPHEPGPSDYVVEAESKSGHRTEMVGSLRVENGHGSLAAPVAGGIDSVDSIRVFQAGQLRYEARF